jgi:hypothetical protein
MSTSSYQKKKKFKQQFRTFVINFFIWLIILSFIAYFGIYNRGGNDQNVKSYNIAQVNDKLYTYQPGSSFSYLLNNERTAYNQQSKAKVDPNSFTMSVVNDLIDYSVLSDFGNKIGLIPSKLVVRSILESFVGSVTASPDPGLLDYVTMQYYRSSFYNNYGDIANAVSVISMPELFSYYDLFKYNAQAEFLYINTTNFIRSKVSDSDLDIYYQNNLSNYVSEVTVEEVSVKTSKTAADMANYIKQNDWDKGLQNYKDQYTYKNNLVLRNTNGMSKRFNRAIALKTGEVLPNPQFELSEYHILRIKSFAQLKDLPLELKDRMLSDYITQNYGNLKVKFDNDMKTASAKAEEMIKAKGDFKQIAAATGMSYSKSTNISPISEVVYDEKQNIIPVPFKSSEWVDFIFTGEKNSVSKTYYNDDFILIIKDLARATTGKYDYQSLNQNIVYNYYYLKNTASESDWFSNLKKKYHIKTFDSDIKKLIATE